MKRSTRTAPRTTARRARSLRAGAALCATVLAACSGPSERGGGDILLISVDTLRPDHLGIYGYARDTTPHLERHFSEAARFERAFATEASTSPSVVSLLTGRAPQQHRVRLFYQRASRDLTFVTERLPVSYESAAFVSNVVLTEEALGISDRFDHYDDFVDERESGRLVFERNARRTTDAALAWLEAREDPERPLFLWVHYIDPHGPYRAPAEWPVRFSHGESVPLEPSRVPSYQQIPGRTDALDYIDAYDEEIAYADRQIGRLLDGYAETGSLQRALVIFTADHGESLLEHEVWFNHGYQVYDSIIRVPLLVRAPGVRQGPCNDVVSGIDIAPTLLHFAGGVVPAELEGRDLVSTDPNAADRVVFSEGGGKRFQWRAAIQGHRKWVARVRRGTREVTRRLYYDLSRDPGEKTTQTGRGVESSSASRRLLAQIEADPDPGGLPERYEKGIQLSAPKVAPGVAPADLERLRALGYAE